jgi:hypothetical protein
MSSRPPNPPSLENSPEWPGKDPQSTTSSDQRRPRAAILNAAIVCLDYARQYLDKFTYWPDYILATHYHANVLALTGCEKNRSDAERSFKDVEFWLDPGDRGHEIGGDARKRIRAEAMYNRAVLMQRRGEDGKAEEQFEAVLQVVGEDREQPPKGIRFAAEFALLMLVGKQVLGVVSGMGSTQSIGLHPPSSERVSMLGQAIVPFLGNCKRELQLLESKIASAETEIKSLEAQILDRKKSSKRKGDRYESMKQDSALQRMLENAKAKITKASKDSAIIRMMISTVQKLRQDLPPTSVPSQLIS